MKIQKLFPFLLFLVALVPLLDLLHPGLPATHDMQNHVVRIANFYQNLAEGTIVPRWGGNLNWGYGHPVLMFLYPLPSYFASLVHAFGFSLVASTKIVFGLAFILSGLTMYLWLQAFLPKTAAFAGSILYILAPYRFVEIYVRGDIGEHVAFVLPPLVLYFLFRLYKSSQSQWITVFPGKDALFGSLSLAGLILAHNAISLMFLPIILLYAFYLTVISPKRKDFIVHTLSLLLFGFALTAFFWIPALFEGKYTLRDILITDDYKKNFVAIPRLLYGQWSYGLSGQFSVQIGILQWFAIAFSFPAMIFFFKKKNNTWVLLCGCLIIFLSVIFLMLPASQLLWQKLPILPKFQFPWRFLAIATFITSVAGGISFSALPKKLVFLVTIMLIIALFFSNSPYWHAKAYRERIDSNYTGVYAGTSDTGESSPIWSVRFMEHFPKAHLESIQGAASIIELRRTSTKHAYTVTATNGTRLRENTVYFPGWKILVDGHTVPVQFQDPNSRGVMTFAVPPGKHTVSVLFTETKLRMIADGVSIASLFGLLICAMLGRRFVWRRFR